MTVTIDRPPPGHPPGGAGPSPEPQPERGRFSIEALQESRAARALMGVLLVAIVAGGVYAILLTFTGHFTNVDKIRAELPANSNAVGVAAPVEYRHITIGKVGSETQGPHGTIATQLEIYPQYLREIPKGVQAEVEPLSIFGNQYVNLVPPATPPAGHLAVTDFVGAFQGAPSSSLQGSVTQLYNLLTAIHPAQLDTALTAFATALNNEGKQLGQTLAGASDYLQAIVPSLPTANSDFKLLGPASQELNQAAPNILGTISNSTVTARTITSDEAALKNLLTQSSASIGDLAGILSTVKVQLPALLNESGPLLRDITQSPNELSQTLSGLTEFASAVAAAEAHGPFLSVNSNLPIADINAGVNAALGYDNPASLNAALGGTVNPPTYTSANCPQYPGQSNPYCGVGGNPDAQPLSPPPGYTVPPAQPAASGAGSSPAPAGQAQPASAASRQDPPSTGPSSSPQSPTTAMMAASSADPYMAELKAAQSVASALNGGRPPAQPGLANLVLVPLLSSLTAQPGVGAPGGGQP